MSIPLSDVLKHLKEDTCAGNFNRDLKPEEALATLLDAETKKTSDFYQALEEKYPRAPVNFVSLFTKNE
jgi:hypothetical protein